MLCFVQEYDREVVVQLPEPKLQASVSVVRVFETEGGVI